MDTLWRWRERLRRLLFKSRVEREVLEEMQYHLDMEAGEHERRGLDRSAARRAARLDFGSIERFREEAREARFGHLLDTLLGDTRYSLRLLRRHPGFAAAAIATLSIGIGAITAVFSLVSSALLYPLPYERPDEIAWIQTHWQDNPSATISPAEYLDYRFRLTEVFEHVGVYSFGAVNLTGAGEPLRLPTAFVSSGVLPALGVHPVRGRSFTQREDDEGARVALIGEGLWNRQFGRREDVVGSLVTLNRLSVEIIGVLPAGLRLPEQTWLAAASELYLPLGIAPGSVIDRGSHYLSGVGRLASSVPLAQAARAVETLAASFTQDHPDAYPADMRFGATATSLARQVRGPVRAPMLALLAGVALLLLIACANVASLILARADLRAREMALRSSLGAERWRIAQQVITESLVLGIAGGVLGLGLAVVALAVARQTFPAGFDWSSMLRLDWRVVLFAISVASCAGAAFGLLPALSLGTGRLTRALKPGTRTSSPAPGHSRSRSFLVSAELALTLVLLVSAGLMIKSFTRLVQVDPGYRTSDVASARVSLPASDYPENADLVLFYRAVTEALGGSPGIDAAGAVTNLPLATRLGDMNFQIEGRPIPSGARSPAADWQVVTPGYLEAMGLTLLEGRTFRFSDRESTTGAVVINRSFAETHWPGESPLGARFELGGRETRPEVVEVVGVVADVRHETLSQTARPQMYLAHEQFRFWSDGRAASSLELVVRSRLEPAAIHQLLSDTVHELDPHLPLSGFRTMEQVREQSVAIPRLLMALLTIFAIAAMLLAAVGVYGVTAQVVARRLPELGIRVALGARPRDVRLSVLRQAAVVLLIGLGAGVAGTLLVTRLLGGLLYRVHPLDGSIVAGVAALLVVTGLGAGYMASGRAATANPTALLRIE